MSLTTKIPSFWAMTQMDLRTFLQEKGFSRFNADQVFDWVYRKHNLNIETWSNISQPLKQLLQTQLTFFLPQVVWHGLSQDGTRKFLLKMQDEQTVEAVIIPTEKRVTICVSSQVGCALACTFCHTGTMGLKRHLEPEEVVGQLMATTYWLREQGESKTKITNIVYMGQGEPLHNYENMKQATLVFLDPHGLGIGQRKITLSTSGLVPQIEKLIDFPPVSIAISLHSARDEVRSRLMPINKVYDLERLLKAIKSIPLKARRRITYEYLMLDGINNSQQDIEALLELLPHQESKVNLIPFNEYPGSEFKRPSEDNIYWFMKELTRRGLFCTVRETRGTDILAACGQLKSMLDKKANTWEAAQQA